MLLRWVGLIAESTDTVTFVTLVQVAVVLEQPLFTWRSPDAIATRRGFLYFHSSVLLRPHAGAGVLHPLPEETLGTALKTLVDDNPYGLVVHLTGHTELYRYVLHVSVLLGGHELIPPDRTDLVGRAEDDGLVAAITELDSAHQAGLVRPAAVKALAAVRRAHRHFSPPSSQGRGR